MQTETPADTTTRPLPPLPKDSDSGPADEHDIDPGDDQDVEEQVLSRDSLPEGVEYLGSAPDLLTYFKRELEELIDPSIAWVLDCVNPKEVQARFEGGKYRYLLEGGCVYRVEVPDPDPPGPCMSTRGV